MTHSPDHDDRAFYGRRKGKALRDGQSHLMEHTLPRLRLPEGEIADLQALFRSPWRPSGWRSASAAASIC